MGPPPSPPRPHAQRLANAARGRRVREVLTRLAEDVRVRVVPRRVLSHGRDTTIALVDRPTSVDAAVLKLFKRCGAPLRRHMHLVFDDLNIIIHVVLVDAFSNEALVNALVSNERAARSVVVPVGHAFRFMSRRGDANGMLLMRRMDMTVRCWKRTRGALSTRNVRVVVFTVAYALHLLQREFGFNHHDLHDDNVAIEVLDDAAARVRAETTFDVDGVVFRLPVVGIRVRLMDFQFSSVATGHDDTIFVGRQDMFDRLGASRLWTSSTAVNCAPSAKPVGVDATRPTTASTSCDVAVGDGGVWGCGRSRDLRTFLRAFLHGLDQRSRGARVIQSALDALRGRDDLRPRDFIMRTFCGAGKFAVADFRV